MKGISIIIPAYNRQKFIKETIQSVFDQEYDGNLEVIISDDGSSDNTLEIAKSFGNSVKILKKRKDCLSQGVSSTRNRGLKAATQPYICFLDSDDFYLQDHLNSMASVLESNPELGFVFSRTLEVKEENGLKLFKLWTQQHISKNDILNPVVSRGNIVHTNCFLFRRVVFDKIGSFNEAYSNGEDQDLWMRISEQYRGAFSDHFGAAYRFQHEAEQLTNNSEEIIRNYLVMVYKNAIERYYQLGLKSSFRIFSLKRNLSNHEYKNFRLMYYLNYIYLIFRYPLAFLQRIPSLYSRFFKKIKTNDWYELSHFLKSDNLIK
jgi:glycosyltransferase involved in cell wall biosynthesis